MSANQSTTASTRRRRRWWGLSLMLLGFLVASLIGLTRSDCALCTWPELLSVWIGGALVLVGAAMLLFRRDRGALGRALAIAFVVGVTLTVAMTVRFGLPVLIWESPHAEGLQE